MTPPDIDERDGPRDECGVFGVFAPGHDVARLIYFALYALQHRGQESAGIATAQGGHIMAMRDQGLVNQVFDEQKLRALQGDMAVAHVRYSTTGANSWENSQPVWRADRREVALGHNGNLVNAVELHTELRERGVSFRSTSDSEIIAALLSTHEADTIEDAVEDVLPRLEGAFSTVVMTPTASSRSATPPGCARSRSACSASATASRRSRARSTSSARSTCARSCPARWSPSPSAGSRRARSSTATARRSASSSTSTSRGPDTRLEGRIVQTSRGRMGELLAAEAPVEADLVIPVPDSGNAAARGYARASGLPQDDGLIKNRYVGRTFIQPGQELRKHGLRLKFNPLPEVVSGQRLVVVDDSIVRGNTTRQIVQMLRDAGAAEVHMRITAPPIRHPCHYGIDMSTREEMIAHEPHGGGDRRRARGRLARLPVARRRLRRDRERSRDALRRLLHGRVPAREHGLRAAEGRVRARAPAAQGLRRQTAPLRSSRPRSTGQYVDGLRNRLAAPGSTIRFPPTRRRLPTRTPSGSGLRGVSAPGDGSGGASGHRPWAASRRRAAAAPSRCVRRACS